MKIAFDPMVKSAPANLFTIKLPKRELKKEEANLPKVLEKYHNQMRQKIAKIKAAMKKINRSNYEQVLRHKRSNLALVHSLSDQNLYQKLDFALKSKETYNEDFYEK